LRIQCRDLLIAVVSQTEDTLHGNDVTQPSRPQYLTLRGLPLEAPPASDELFFWFDPQGEWRPSRLNASDDVEAECVRLHDAFAAVIFGSLTGYHQILRSAPDFVSTAGLTSECNVSRTEFERLVRQSDTPAEVNKLLYLADCHKLVTSVQECTKEVLYLQGEFYRALNLDPLFFPPVEDPDGIRWMTSPVVTNIHATLGFLFVRLHSLLDYTTKLAFEAENLRSEFASYPRLASSKILFGDRKRVAINKAQGTLFEASAVVTEIELYRNQIIHDGLLDDMPKVYKVVESGITIEKFVLLPDRGAQGHFEKFRNRYLFYSNEDRINLRLPELIAEFQQRQITTLKQILGLIHQPKKAR
jgi:hypothetical protein